MRRILGRSVCFAAMLLGAVDPMERAVGQPRVCGASPPGEQSRGATRSAGPQAPGAGAVLDLCWHRRVVSVGTTAVHAGVESGSVLKRLLEDLASSAPAGGVSDSEFEARAVLKSPQPLDVAGLRLAFDCLCGDEAAVLRLKEMLENAAVSLGRDLVPDEDQKAELLQHTYVLLLYGGPRKNRGYLMTYEGRAPLQAWLRTVLVRQSLANKRRREKEMPLDVLIEDIAADQGVRNPELELIKQKYLLQFNAALRQSMTSLSARERLVLRHHLVDRLTAEQIGDRFEVHRVTVARWMRGIRRVLLEQTIANLKTMLEKDDDDVDVVFSLIESRINSSFGGLRSSATT